MAIVTRTAKGSKLTIAEMDGNLTTLQSSSFQDGVYSQSVIGSGAVLSLSANVIDDATVGVYTNISPASGSGTGLVVDIEITEGERGLQADYIIVDGGSGYAEDDVLIIENTDIGGVSGTYERSIFPGEVSVTSISSISVTEDRIALSSTTISITGSVTLDNEITTTGNILGNSVTATNMLQGQSLIISSLFANTSINFSNLPTEDPMENGQLWNDSGSLKISAGE